MQSYKDFLAQIQNVIPDSNVSKELFLLGRIALGNQEFNLQVINKHGNNQPFVLQYKDKDSKGILSVEVQKNGTSYHIAEGISKDVEANTLAALQKYLDDIDQLFWVVEQKDSTSYHFAENTSKNVEASALTALLQYVNDFNPLDQNPIFYPFKDFIHQNLLMHIIKKRYSDRETYNKDMNLLAKYLVQIETVEQLIMLSKLAQNKTLPIQVEGLDPISITDILENGTATEREKFDIIKGHLDNLKVNENGRVANEFLRIHRLCNNTPIFQKTPQDIREMMDELLEINDKYDLNLSFEQLKYFIRAGLL